MSHYLHVCKKYDVVYGDRLFTNYGADNVRNLLESLEEEGLAFYFSEDDRTIEINSNPENIEILETYCAEIMEEPEKVNEFFEEEGETNKEVAEDIRKWIETADKRYACLRGEFF
jgi:hypothetical protein